MKELLNLTTELNVRPEIIALSQSEAEQATLTCKEEDVVLTITFHSVVAFRMTIYKDAEFSKYEGKIVDLGESDWLEFIHVRQQGVTGQFSADRALRHLLVNFCDGPSYEFVCKNVEILIKDPLDRTRGGQVQKLKV